MIGHTTINTMNKLKLNKRNKRILLFDALLIAALLVSTFAVKAPEEVQGLEVKDTTYDTAAISWQPSDNAATYQVYRSVDGKDYEYLDTVTDTEYTDTDLRTGTEYSYKIRASHGIRKTSVKDAKPTEATPALDQPEFKVSTDNGQIELKISDVDGATGYEIYRDDKKISSQADTVFIDKDAENDEKHSYKVRAERVLPEETPEEEPEAATGESPEDASGDATKDAVKEDRKETSDGEAPAEPEAATDEAAAEEPETAYSDFSKTKEAELISVGNLTAEIVGDDISVTWEPSETYTSYKLFKGDELLTETQSREYIIHGFDADEKYDLKLVGYADDIESPAEKKTYAITKEAMSNKEAVDEACKWAEMIAADDSFTYGAGKRAHRYGCYFCGTNVGPNLNKKGKSLVNGHSYEKTYCCNPFVHAAFAHGAGDPAMLKACQRGGGVSMSAKSYTRYGHWKNMGKISYGSLKRGDVLVCPSHVALYVGNGKIAQAADNDGAWTANSIRVNGMGKSKYEKKWKFVMRYTGTGRGYKYGIKEVTNTDTDNDTDSSKEDS